jgi:hypothetical protein
VAWALTGQERSIKVLLGESAMNVGSELTDAFIDRITSPSLIVFDIDNHKFCVLCLPKSNQFALLQSNQDGFSSLGSYVGAVYSLVDWIERTPVVERLPFTDTMSKDTFRIFCNALKSANDKEKMKAIFGVPFSSKGSQGRFQILPLLLPGAFSNDLEYSATKVQWISRSSKTLSQLQ